VITARVKEKRTKPVVPRLAPKGSHQSQGKVENCHKRVEAQVKVMGMVLEFHYEEEWNSEHRMVPWAIRHAGWLITRYAVQASGHAAYFYVCGKEYTGEIVELGETILFKDPMNKGGKIDSDMDEGIWLGKDWLSDEHLVAKGSDKYKARTIRRLPEEKRWNKILFQQVTAVPWGLKGQQVESTPGTRRRYITAKLVRRHGGTKGCAGCLGTGTHNERCRDRFEKIISKEDATLPIPPSSVPLQGEARQGQQQSQGTQAGEDQQPGGESRASSSKDVPKPRSEDVDMD
jgi:hypothetical protein